MFLKMALIAGAIASTLYFSKKLFELFIDNDNYRGTDAAYIAYRIIHQASSTIISKANEQFSRKASTEDPTKKSVSIASYLELLDKMLQNMAPDKKLTIPFEKKIIEIRELIHDAAENAQLLGSQELLDFVLEQEEIIMGIMNEIGEERPSLIFEKFNVVSDNLESIKNAKTNGDQSRNSKDDSTGSQNIFVDYYKVLGLSFGASDVEIKSAYKKQARKYHPDANAGLEDHIRELAQQKMQEINEAYSILKDSQKKAAYDVNFR